MLQCGNSHGNFNETCCWGSWRERHQDISKREREGPVGCLVLAAAHSVVRTIATGLGDLSKGEKTAAHFVVASSNDENPVRVFIFDSRS